MGILDQEKTFFLTNSGMVFRTKISRNKNLRISKISLKPKEKFWNFEKNFVVYLNLTKSLKNVYELFTILVQ